MLYNPQQYWPLLVPRTSFTPFQTKFHAGKLKVFLRSAVKLLKRSLSASSERTADASVVFQLLSRRVFPELEAMRDEDAFECRCLAVRVALRLLLCIDSTEKPQVAALVRGWILEPSEWQRSVKQEVVHFVRPNLPNLCDILWCWFQFSDNL